ncbi:DNA (cytosine-5-)-methyltransferase [Sediminibacterium sp.]|uniref:DNA cytosine methyltransferase n=1 Tax=Sediminibacterium sp. TaxID=1917865 RepID=UPI0025E4A0B2|nr:DNA (cytosine-5-)-methyltransferase [Sediminibacterium sp.]MBW0176671.1 DNA cytosine methyltransferase [Sediminibacterium sp.]
MTKKLTFIDLFAGAGGLSEGFIRAGFEPIAHVEMDEAACYTLKTRVAYHYLKANGKFNEYKKYLEGKINRTELYSNVPAELLESVINLPIGGENNPEIHKTIEKLRNGRKVDLIIGGPPCQAYSLVGRARSRHGMKGDHRNYLYVQYAKYLEKYEPKIFVFENVLGLKSAGNGIYLRNMEKLFDSKGYHMKLFTVEANNFGVLQNRKRVIIIGWQNHKQITLPDLEAIRSKVNHTVKELLSDLPMLQAGEGTDKYVTYAKPTTAYLNESGIRNGIDILTQHVARPNTEQDKEIYRIAVEKMQAGERLSYTSLPKRLRTHKNEHSFFDRFKVVNDKAAYSQTVVAHIAKDGHYYIHPDIKQNRSLTVREAARLQSFPDDFYFEGVKEGKNRTAAFKQIGNAVPVLMGEKIATKLKNLL